MSSRQTSRLNRRQFALTSTAFASAIAAPAARAADSSGPLKLGVIGVSNRGASNLREVASERIEAICDVDSNYLDMVGQRFPEARRYRDYRELLDNETQLDGVVISTPDHHHAPATMRAIEKGLAVYCEKPLTHTVAEARAVSKAAQRAGVVTQMGTQIHATSNYRRVVEMVRAGAVGSVHNVDVWVSKDWGAAAMPEANSRPAPDSIAWNLWLGPADKRAYTPGLHPGQWRRYRPYGTGTLGDMGCHYMDLPFWALGLVHPSEVAAEGPPADPMVCPQGLRIRYRFAANDRNDQLDMTWHDGALATDFISGRELPSSGVLFRGDRGQLLATYTKRELTGKDKAGSWESDVETIPASPGHHAEWLSAIRGGPKPLCEFGYAGPLTETVLLGTVAHQAGRRLTWDGERAAVIGDAEANDLLTKSYRAGWEIFG